MSKNKECNVCLMTFRPRITEFDVNNKMINLCKWLDKCSQTYILSYEKGGSNDISHFHLFLDLTKGKRYDKLKEQIKKQIRKDYDIKQFDNEKICFDFINITTPYYYDYYLGYVFKEDNKKVRFSRLDIDFNEKLLFYKSENEKKKLSKDKIRINNKNINIVIYNFCIVKKISPSNDHRFVLDSDFGRILDLMLENDYYIGSLSERQLLHLGRMTISYLNYRFFNISSTYFSDKIEELLEKESQFD